MVITVQESVKRGQGKLLLGCLAFALALQLQLFLFTPSYTPRPYALEEAPFAVIDIPEDVEIVEIPVSVPMPKPSTPTFDGTGKEETEIIDTKVLEFRVLPCGFSGNTQEFSRPFYAFDEAPILTYRAPVRYSPLAREARMEGTVFLKVFIDARGKVVDAQVLASSAPAILIASALEAVRKWRFQPGKQRDVPVPTAITVPIDFRPR